MNGPAATDGKANMTLKERKIDPLNSYECKFRFSFLKVKKNYFNLWFSTFHLIDANNINLLL